MEVEGNDIKKHASHRSDESYYDRKDRKKASSKIGQEVNREESRSKRRRSSSRERRNHQRTKNRSLSTSPKEHKRTSYHDREYEDPSHHAYKEKHVSKHHEVDKNRRNNSGSGTLYRRYGDSGIGGYSPRKRRTEAAVRTPSPTLRSPERRSAAWDVKPVGAEVAASIPTLALLTPSQMSLLNGHEVPAVSPVISTAPNPYPASITIALTSVGNNASEDAVQLTQATRPSRRLYVENIPASISDKELIECFNKFLSSSGSNHVQGRQPCISCMVNREKKQALLEFLAPEDATRALSFEGNSFGGAVLRMKRPKDFVESANGALDKVGPNVDSISDIVKDSPHKATKRLKRAVLGVVRLTVVVEKMARCKYGYTRFIMNKQGQGQPPTVMGMVGGGPVAYSSQPYQAAQMVSPGPAGAAVGNVQSHGQPVAFPTSPAEAAAQNQLVYQHLQQQQQAHQFQQLQLFWANQLQEIEKTTEFKNHSLPLARIKKIMKADEDVRMIAAEAPIVFAKACEMFILELTLRSWIHTEENKRRTLQKNDIAAAITRTDIFDFLVDIVPRDELKDEVITEIPGTGPLPIGPPPEMLSCYYMPGPPIGGQGMIMGGPVMDPSLFTQHPHPYLPHQMWPPPPQTTIQEEEQPTNEQ